MIYFIVWLVTAIVSGMIGSSKGRTGLGWLLGILLGPIGMIIMAVIPANTEAIEAKQVSAGGVRKCPYCAELVKSEAIICKHCGKDLPPEETSAPEKEKIYEEWTCSKCGSHNKAGTLKCYNCLTDNPI